MRTERNIEQMKGQMVSLKETREGNNKSKYQANGANNKFTQEIYIQSGKVQMLEAEVQTHNDSVQGLQNMLNKRCT